MVGRGINGPSNMDIWGRERNYYTFADLAKWLKRAGDPLDTDSDSSGDGKRGRKKTDKKGKGREQKKSLKSKSAKRM